MFYPKKKGKKNRNKVLNYLAWHFTYKNHTYNNTKHVRNRWYYDIESRSSCRNYLRGPRGTRGHFRRQARSIRTLSRVQGVPRAFQTVFSPRIASSVVQDFPFLGTSPSIGHFFVCASLPLSFTPSFLCSLLPPSLSPFSFHVTCYTVLL